jgi:hypothetical protein
MKQGRRRRRRRKKEKRKLHIPQKFENFGDFED